MVGRIVALALTAVLPLSTAAAEENPAADAGTRQYATAAALQNREQYELAIEEWTKFLAAYPKHERADKALHYLGLCHLQTKTYDQAAAAFGRAIADFPRSPLVEPSYLYLGLAQYNQARAGKPELYAKADATFRALLEKYPRTKNAAQALFYRGESLYAQGSKAEAAKLYEQIVKQFPKDPQLPEALYALGVAQEELGQAAAADASYSALLRQFPQHALVGEVTMRRGEALVAQKKYEQAEKLFATAAARPDFALADQALLRQAAAVSERGQHAEAAALYASFLKKFPQSKLVPAAELALGKCQYLAGKTAEARAMLEPLVAAGGEPAGEAGYWIARAWLKEGQPDKALAVAERAVPRAGQGAWLPQLRLARADALVEMPGRAGEAIAAYASIAKESPDDPGARQALYMAGFASLKQQQYEPASAYVADFLRRYPRDELRPDVMFVGAESQLQLAHYAEAAGQFAALAKAYPRHRDLEQWQVRRGLALFLNKKYADVLAALEPVAGSLADKPRRAEAFYLLGAAQNELHQYGPASKALTASLDADPKWKQADETLLALAVALERSGDASAARARLEQLAKSFPESTALDRVHFHLAELAYAAADWSAADREYRTVIERSPRSALAPQAIYGLAWTQISQQDHAAAAKTLDALVADRKAGELSGKARYARAFARQHLKHYAAAIEDLQAFLQSSPPRAERSEALYLLGVCQAGEGKPADAEATLRKLLLDEPKYAGADKVLYELSWALDAQNKKAEASESFFRLARERADSPYAAESLYYVGEFQYGAQNYPQAAAAYYDAMHKAGKNELGEKAAHKLGWAYFRQGEFDKARQTFDYERKTFPTGGLAADAAFMQAECLFKQNKFEDALNAYAQVKNPAGKDFAVLALLHAGQAAAQLKQWDRSLELLNAAARQFPDSEFLPEVLYEQGWAKQNLDRLDDALALYESVTAKSDAEVAARARFMIGEIYFQKKDHATAVRNFFKAAFGYGYSQWQAAAHYEAGRCFEEMNKLDQAKKSYQEVVDKHPQSDQAGPARKRLAALGK
ncbi:MAG: tetratricopeptide repeat protein [Planctomycetia bacterium]|nr:tetratricopeptide repeat protein [Planctomycetia bacterium]